MTIKAITPAEKLRQKLFYYLAGALLLMATCLTAMLSISLFRKLVSIENHSVMHQAQTLAMAVSEWRNRISDITMQISIRSAIRQELEKFASGEISIEQLKEFTNPKLQDSINQTNIVLGIIRIDSSRQVITVCGICSELSQEELKRDDLISDSVRFSSPVTIGNKTVIIVGAPILKKDKFMLGTDLVFFDLGSLNEILKKSEHLDNQSITILGYNKDGSARSVLEPFEISAHFSRDNSVRSSIESCLLKAAEGESGITDAGSDIVAYHPVSDSNWGLIVSRNQNELYSPIYKQIFYIVILAAALYCLILIGFATLLKPLASQLFLHTTELEVKIKEKTENLEQEILIRKKAEEDKKHMISELKNAIQEIRTLSGMLPICSSCKKIRDDKGYWNQLETYISKHSDTEFTHSICPDCLHNLYPELEDEILSEIDKNPKTD